MNNFYSPINLPKFFFAFCLTIVSGISLFAQNNSNTLWQTVLNRSGNTTIRENLPTDYRLLELNLTDMRQLLASAPMENTLAASSSPLLIQLPTPTGDFKWYKVYEAPVMHPDLAAAYPFIKTYIAEGLNDRYASGRLDVTQWGFHGLFHSLDGYTIIDPYELGDTVNYLCYYKHNSTNRSDFECATLPADETEEPALQDLSLNVAERSNGTQLRTYRLALACTGEYAAYYGGTRAGAFSGMVTSVNRVNYVYEREVAIRFTLVPNDTLLIYLNATTDPYTNNNGATMLNENQTNITNVIGSANYDIGHVFSTGGGGIAQLQCICSSANKARGVTGSAAPIGDNFDIDYVAHEMGHQFGGNHTFNCTTGSCNGNRSSTAAYEPGSGTTIMAYAGICTATNNTQAHSDPFFHVKSFDEIVVFSTTGNGNTCPVRTNTGNSVPIINRGANYTIPFQTPFQLTGSATDPDGDALTYCWEQYNLGAAGNWNAPVGDAPIFRSFAPVSVPFRIFPKMSDIVTNTTTIGELLPTYARVLNFKFTARDNKAGGGGVTNNDTTVAVTVINTTTPFRVTNPNTALTWNVGSTQTVTWDVSSTIAAPISCANVKISLSTDGGYNYPITLVASTANDGSEVITVPNNPSTTARVKVEAVGNIFFDISNTNFTIAGVVIGPISSIATSALSSNTICRGDSFILNWTMNGVGNAGNQFIAELSNAAGSFTAPTVIGTITSTSATSMMVTIPAGTALGTGYRIRVRSTAPAITGSNNGTNISIITVPGNAGAITGASTICAGQTGVAYSVAAVANATTYNWSLPSGASITAGSGTNNITVTFGTSTSPGSITVTPANQCGVGGTSPAFAVTVNGLGAITGSSSVCKGDVGLTYSMPPASGTPTYTWSVPTGFTITAGGTTNSITVSVTNTAVTGIVKARVTTACGTDSAQVLVTVGTSPTAPVVAATGNTTFCQGDSVLLSTTSVAGVNYQWLLNNSPIAGATSNSFYAKQTGSYTLNASSQPLAYTTFSNTTTTAIPDNSCTGGNPTIAVSGLPTAYPALGISIRFNITHPFLGDVALFLVSPQGNILGITNRTGNTNNAGQNYTNTVLSDLGRTAIPTAGAPYTDVYRPAAAAYTSCITSNRTSFNALGTAGVINPNGTWTLRAFDRAGTDVGSVINWEIRFESITGCSVNSNSVAVSVASFPTVYTVTGGGAYCSTANGVAVGLSGSQSGVSYQLRRNGTNIGSAVNGTGNALAFGNQTIAGSYTVVATNATNCASTMNGSATVSVTAATLWYRDADNDGYGNGSDTSRACTRPTGYVSVAGDCNDNNSAVRPNATEVCNGIDDNCNSQTDEGVTTTYYADADNDGFGNPSVSVQACSVPVGYVTNNTDCNDNNAAINPNTVWYLDADADLYYTGAGVTSCNSPGAGYTRTVTAGGDCNDANPAVHPNATEVCNGIDDNCNSQTDEGVTTTYYADADNDGFGNPTVSVQACSVPVGYVTNNTDCNDNNAAINPNTVWYLDADADLYYTGAGVTSCNSPGTGYTRIVLGGGDCNDANANIHPNATEVCNGIDDNCNSFTDEGISTITYYQDFDNDGFGNPNVSVQSCNQPAGYVINNTDCNDNNSSVHALSTWYLDADGDLYYTGTPVSSCGNPGLGYTAIVSGGGDCNDADANIHPNATEVCNGIDDNCNSFTDEGISTITYYQDFDNDGFGNPNVSVQSCNQPAGYVINNTDCNDNNSSVHALSTWYLDADGDLYYTGTPVSSCGNPGLGYTAIVSGGGDCNDANANIHPNATEVCNGIDDNCNSFTDEGLTLTYYQDLDNDTYGNDSVRVQACNQPAGYVTDNTDCDDTNPNVNPGAAEIAFNGIDDNCDTQIDENNVTAIENTVQNTIRIYPNPLSAEFLNIQFSNEAVGFELKIYDLSGRLVHASALPAMLNTINLSALSKSVYLISVENAETRVYDKLVIE